MNWIDIRVRKPEEKDAKHGDVWVLFADESSCSQSWYRVADGRSSAIAWLDPKTLPKFTPIPDPPEGYRWIDREADKPQLADDLYWSYYGVQAWRMCVVGADSFCRDDAYARRIDPPKPEYRAFASLEEWWPHRERWVRIRHDVTKVSWVGPQVAEMRFKDGAVFVNDDGTDDTPFGIKAE
jgi:hypothetical protein